MENKNESTVTLPLNRYHSLKEKEGMYDMLQNEMQREAEIREKIEGLRSAKKIFAFSLGFVFGMLLFFIIFGTILMGK